MADKEGKLDQTNEKLRCRENDFDGLSGDYNLLKNQKQEADLELKRLNKKSSKLIKDHDELNSNHIRICSENEGLKYDLDQNN